MKVLNILYFFGFSSKDFNFFHAPIDELIKSIAAEAIDEDGSQNTQNIEISEDVDMTETEETQNIAAEMTGSFKCTICDMLFKSNSGRNQHIRSMHSNDQKYYYCRDCGEKSKFAHLRNLKAHTKSKHGRLPLDVEISETVQGIEDAKRNTTNFNISQ